MTWRHCGRYTRAANSRQTDSPVELLQEREAIGDDVLPLQWRTEWLERRVQSHWIAKCQSLPADTRQPAIPLGALTAATGGSNNGDSMRTATGKP